MTAAHLDDVHNECATYSMTRNQEAIRRLFRVRRDLTGNLPPLPAIFPDMMAPIVRFGDDGHAAVYNTFNLQRHLVSRPTHRQFRTAAQNSWSDATAAAA